MALALEVPLYKFFYEGDEAPQTPPLPVVKKKPLRNGVSPESGDSL